MSVELFIENRAQTLHSDGGHAFKDTGIETPADLVATAAKITDRAALSDFKKTRSLELSHWCDRNVPGAVRDGAAVLDVFDSKAGAWQDCKPKPLFLWFSSAPMHETQRKSLWLSTAK